MKLDSFTLTGKWNAKHSWEKAQVYDLDNGVQITVSYSPHYGEFVSRADDDQGYWHCSNGQNTIPERMAFLRNWITPIAPGHWMTLVRPNFNR